MATKKTAKVRRRVRTLTIDKGRWLTGDSSEAQSCLLHSETGRMCCIGFAGKRFGLTDEAMMGFGSPARVPSKLWPRWLLHKDGGNTGLCGELMRDNDAKDITRKEREKRIAAGFAEHGIKVRYVGRYPRKKAAS